jgi:putative transposase
MARLARVVMPGVWHHVTQRGNRRQMVFSSDEDRAMYLALLQSHCTRAAVRITGYCLMGNHVHLIVAPEKETSLAQALGRTHNDYARWLNLRRGETGHLWQNRYYSCPLDEPHQWAALRYVELNPVRAALAADPASWPWSSARAHLTGVDQSGILDMTEWQRTWTAETWQKALEVGVGDAGLVERIRHATRTGRPAGGSEFVKHWEQRLKRPLSPAKRGPTPKGSAEDGQMEWGVW